MGARRVEGLLSQRVEGELLVIRESTEEAHALNETAAIVFELCDGETTAGTMAAEIARRSGLPADDAIIELALSELEDAGLIIREAATASAPTRRSLIRRLALSAATVSMLPVVETVLIRPAKAAPPLPDPPTTPTTSANVNPTSFEPEAFPCPPGQPPDRPFGGPPGAPPRRPGDRLVGPPACKEPKD